MSDIALIIGASSGLGAACVTTFARAGFSVLGAARRVERIREVIDRLDIEVGTHEALRLDVRRRDEVGSLVAELVRVNRVPRVIVYCAGINKYGPLEEMDPEDWDDTFAVNARGAFYVCKEFATHLKSGSRIIIVGSTAGLDPFEEGAIYCASKAALHALAISLRKELNPRNIFVSLITPGSMNTEFWAAGRPDSGSLLSADAVSQLIAAVALTPEGNCVTDLTIRPAKEF
jgi:hypothetical protein